MIENKVFQQKELHRSFSSDRKEIQNDSDNSECANFIMWLSFFFLKEMEKSDANNFLILFRDSGCQFRSLYTYCPDTEEINKLTGIGPKSITKKMIEGLYKYNSDRKQFSHIPAKTLSASVDAITIHSHLWQTKRPVTPKKLLPTKA